MKEQFEYVLNVSAGWKQVRLTLSDDDALIEYDSAGMGAVPVRYVLQCEHKQLSDFHGVLIMTSLERYKTLQKRAVGSILTESTETVDIGHLIDPAVEDEEMLAVLNRLDIEYIRLPQPQLRLEEPGGNWGVHDRTQTFSIVLLIHYAGFWFDEDKRFTKTPLGRGLEALDKLPLAVAEGKYSIRT